MNNNVMARFSSFDFTFSAHGIFMQPKKTIYPIKKKQTTNRQPTNKQTQTVIDVHDI
jgi:hypothetical protein